MAKAVSTADEVVAETASTTETLYPPPSPIYQDCPTTQAAVRDAQGRDLGAVDAVPTRCRSHLLRNVIGAAGRAAILHTRTARWRLNVTSATEETCLLVSFCSLVAAPCCRRSRRTTRRARLTLCVTWRAQRVLAADRGDKESNRSGIVPRPAA